MSIKVNVHGIEVSCDTPEQAVAVASATAALKVPKPDDVLHKSKGPIRLIVNNVTVECESPEAAAATLIAASGVSLGHKKRFSLESRGRQGEGPRRAWAEAEAYAAKHNISKDEARRILAKKKKELMAQALMKVISEKK
jgi:hypothetical protein